MALVLQLLPLLLSRARGEPGEALLGSPGDRVNLSCAGVSHPIRWAWAPSFPACQGLSKGRRPILWASTSEIPTVPPFLPFAGRLRSLDPGIRRLELLVSAGDSGSFFCRGPREEESRTRLHVLGDTADCRATRGPVYPQVLILLLGTGLALGLGALGVVWWRHSAPTGPRRPRRPRSLCSPCIAPFVKGAPQEPAEEEAEPETPRGLGQEEPSLLYAELDYSALRMPRRLSSAAPADAATVYAVVVEGALLPTVGQCSRPTAPFGSSASA